MNIWFNLTTRLQRPQSGSLTHTTQATTDSRLDITIEAIVVEQLGQYTSTDYSKTPL